MAATEKRREADEIEEKRRRRTKWEDVNVDDDNGWWCGMRES